MGAQVGEYADLEIRILKRDQEEDGLHFPVEITLNGRQRLARGRLDPYTFTDDLAASGEKLFAWLLDDATLRAAWTEARGANPARQVRLHIDAEEPKLHRIPWELLRDPGGSGKEPQHIATHAATPFSRYLAGPWQPGGPIYERPIRVLVAIANPTDAGDYGLDRLDVEAEFSALEKATAGPQFALARLQTLPTLTALESALRRVRPHVLHLIAHGSYRAEPEKTVLFLVDDQGKADLIPADRFVSMIASQLGDGGNPLRLVYLGSCQTAISSPADAFRGLAQRLIAAGVPAVFAMQDLVPIVTNRDFSAAFYERLLDHGLVDLAANQARATLASADRPGFAIPVLFSRLPGNRLLAFRRSAEDDLHDALALLADLPAGDIPAPSPVPPHSRLLLPDDPNFTGREDQLKELAAALKEGKPTVVSGLGGMGKSSLANAFAHRYGRYFAGGVFWLSFADPAAIPSEIAACGRALALRPDYDTLDLPTQAALTRRAWQEEVPRVLIFDNCEDETLVDTYRPTTGGCRLLVTSRSAAWDPSRGLHTVHLQTFPPPDSIAFLRKLAPRLTDEEAGAIAAELGDFPLALHLAGSFLSRYRSITAATYLAGLRHTNPLHHPSLEGRGVDYNPTRHERSVHRTFLLSLERLDLANHVDALANDLLRRAACFAPGEAIPYDLLLSTLPADNPASPGFILDAEDAFRRLLAIGLLEPAGENSSRLHRLLATFVTLLGVDEKVAVEVEEAIGFQVKKLGRHAPPAAFATVFPHLRHATASALARAEDAHAAELSSWLAYILESQGDYAAARPLYERALAIVEVAVGPDHPGTATCLNNLAGLVYSQGDYAAARPLYERALAIAEDSLGPNHPGTATTLNSLAHLLKSQGDYAAARPLHERALAIREQNLDPDHPDTAQSLNNLALLLYAQGDYAAARPLYERAIAIREKTLGTNHPATATSLSNLALLLDAQGDYAAARPFYERALAIREQALGPDHPDTAMSLYDLAGLLDSLGDQNAARPLHERALAIREQVLGLDHPDTAMSLNNLAGLLASQGDYAGARALLERALAIREKALGPHHPYTAHSLSDLGSLLRTHGDYSAARPLYERAIAIMEKTFGPDHPKARTVRSNLDHLDALAAEDE